MICCLDACFTQKRRHGAQDPELIHPETVFISAKEVDAVEQSVNAQRGPNHRFQKKPSHIAGNYEHQIKVPDSILDECEQSFLAADEKRQKASTQFFSDTGLMALLCRHDRVLWLVNMTSPGERQHYVLALLYRLFRHLPSSMTVGLLYDIGCQLHQSCVKWHFLEEFSTRITFGISVFHAYGHQWPCQIIYHPRKCKGFGLSDGEGCERLWSAIKPLIPSLRVSGVSYLLLFVVPLLTLVKYHHRIYTIDAQIKHLESKSLLALGTWLSKKWQNCQDKKAEAFNDFISAGVEEHVLRAQWEEQVKAQTKAPIRKHIQMHQSMFFNSVSYVRSISNIGPTDHPGNFELDRTVQVFDYHSSINGKLHG